MHKSTLSNMWACGPFILTLTACLLAGCQSGKNQPLGSAKAEASPRAVTAAPAESAVPSAPATPTAPVEAITPPPPPAPVTAPAASSLTLTPPVRIDVGMDSPYTDSNGNTWLPDQGFIGGEVVDRPGLEIANTKDPTIYCTERYSMESFSCNLPNGKYVVKLHFCETYEGIDGPGQRVFSFNVQGQEFKDFDVWVKAGGFLRPYIETVSVDVTDGKLLITFTHNIENPQICGLEILPAS